MSASSPERSSPPHTPLTDLNAGVASGALVVTAESREDPIDRQHRHRQEAADAVLRRWKDGARFVIAALFLAAAVYVSAHFAFDLQATADEKAWARTVLSGIVTAGAGYFIGRGHRE